MALNKKTVDDINAKGKRVLVRCDFNVPLKAGEITAVSYTHLDVYKRQMKEYAPKMLSKEEVTAIVKEKFADVIATKNKGQIMKTILPVSYTHLVWAMGDDLKTLQRSAEADVNLVVSAVGLRVAKILWERCV